MLIFLHLVFITNIFFYFDELKSVAFLKKLKGIEC